MNNEIKLTPTVGTLFLYRDESFPDDSIPPLACCLVYVRHYAKRILWLYYVLCILNVAGTAFEISSITILIALMCTRIPPSPDNFKAVIKYKTFMRLEKRPPEGAVSEGVNSPSCERRCQTS